ncbi:MAG: SLBB domain-containing protein [Bacteroidetes bacterium]|nr:SLBB domain-containing protein [Bacteroidota bacterium]
MKSIHKFTYFLVLLCFCAFAPAFVFAQQNVDLNTIRVDQLSDDQIEELVKRAQDAGLSSTDFLMIAQMRGMPSGEVEKLRSRIEGLSVGSSKSRSTNVSKRSAREQINLNDITKGLMEAEQLMEEEEADTLLFGSNLFFQKNRKLSFEPSLNQATPKNYILGPGDLIYVDIYGQSEKYYEATVNPEGSILLDNIGLIAVSGKTIEAATEIVKNRVASFYTGLSGANPKTFLQVTLGNVKTIKVHILNEVRLPGTFTLSAFSTVFNALYAAGGPSDNGTLRAIQLIRNNKKIAEIDVYDLLINGTANLNVQLQDQDVLLVNPYLARAKVLGEVKRPLIFEVSPEDTLDDLLRYAGGFTDLAFKDRISISRITGNQRSISDVYSNQLDLFTLKGGDEIAVGRILDRFSNRIQIKGAVFRPGTFALTEGLTLSQLIKNADGLKGDAYTQRASILRTKGDLSSEVLEVNLQAVMEGRQEDVVLQREDVIRISSIYDVQNERYIQILGEVKRPGTYSYATGMTPEELILTAGGLQESANIKDIEIARRLEDSDSGTLSDIITTSINPDLSFNPNAISLEPFDQVIVRKRANFTMQRLVSVEGQVNSPGLFAIQTSIDRISDLVKRAGGVNQFAYTKGATLIRKTEFFTTESEQVRRQKNLEALRVLLKDEPNNAEAQEELLKRLFRDLPKEKVEEKDSIANDAKRESLDEIAAETPGVALKIKETEAVAINLEKILANPGSEEDLLLEEGDILDVPKLSQTVRMRGDVVYPTTLRHEQGRGLRFYINGAGGFDRGANRKQTYVVYANGAVKRTKGVFGVRSYPAVEPGAEVIIPSKGPKSPLRLGELVGVTTGLATLALVLSQINLQNTP